MNAPHVLILAAGQGKRMRSELPKVLHPVLFRPMIHYVIDLARSIPHASITLVVGHGEEKVKEACREYTDIRYVTQREQRGTAHAVQMAERPLSQASGDLLVLSGDVMLLTEASLGALLQEHRKGRLATILTAKLSQPAGYGRILREGERIVGIREEVDCSPSEKALTEVNAGVYLFQIGALFPAIRKVEDRNQQGEFYLTDAVGLLASQPPGVGSVCLRDPQEMTGINDRAALAEVEQVLRDRVNRRFMLSGVTMRDPRSIFIDPRCEIEPDTLIENNVTLIQSRVGTGSRIKQGCYIESSVIGPECSIGPYAHLRPGSRLERGVKIGNFVELKKAVMGEGSKASHLSYIGDAEIGADVNLGCGFITCNFDGGPTKHRTVIEDGVFIGSDTQTVAPVRLGQGSYVASGTTVTKDVPAGALAISRGRQENKLGYAQRLRERILKRGKSTDNSST